MSCLLAITLFAAFAAGAAPLLGTISTALAAIDDFLDRFGHEVSGTAHAKERPPL